MEAHHKNKIRSFLLIVLVGGILLSIYLIQNFWRSDFRIRFRNNQLGVPRPPIETNPVEHVAHQEEGINHISTEPKSTCLPARNFVFIKTRKTGGSTTSNILFRYGMRNNLTAVLQEKAKAFINMTSANTPDIVHYGCSSFKGYNYIANHMQYNRAVMDQLVPNAKFFTILRSPYQQFHSAFYWYGYYDRLVAKGSKHPFDDFFKSTSERIVREQIVKTLSRIKNSQSWMLGLNPEYQDDETAVDLKIKELDRGLDLVMLLEYYEESLVLLKRLLCWNDDDMFYYVSKAHGSEQMPLPHSVESKIEKWNSADFKLYNHFNKTFWRKVKNYNGDFERDLENLRTKQRDALGRCEETNYANEFCTYLKLDNVDLRKIAFQKQRDSVC
ncbi:galactosylceramide sulfotransferase-like [Ptychodera flava]|uniref:galactosylceramide sulfotransferase-like n=1 Tax=Ptychodera flava TaxID=63121 RepID=UPI003969EC26